MRGKKTTPDLVEQAKAIYLLYDNYSEVARILNLPITTVKGIIDSDDEFAEVRKEYKRVLIFNTHAKAGEFLDTLDPNKAKSQAELAIVYGTLIDKNTVLSGENNKWSAQNINIGDNKKIQIVISPEAKSLVERGKQIN